MLKILKKDLKKLYSAIAESATLYIPCNTGGKTDYAVWGEGAEVDLETLKTVKSAKSAFFPQCEDIVSFRREGKDIKVESSHKESGDIVLFGVRACDAKSFDILDSVFLSDPVDSFYKTKREHSTVVTLACSAPEETCFCTVFGIDPAEPAGDASAWFSGEYLYIQPNTEKGVNLTKTLESVLLPEGEDDKYYVEWEKTKTREITARLPLKDLEINNWGGDDLLEKFNSPKWAELSEACLGCGACTFVCPTCQCYDVRDFDKGNGVQRYRCWDSCMYKDFTMMAHGTPRPTQLQRFRQRFMHKLVYYPSNNNGVFGCVGCGRCLETCPIKMNIAKVIKAFGGEKND